MSNTTTARGVRDFPIMGHDDEEPCDESGQHECACTRQVVFDILEVDDGAPNRVRSGREAPEK